MFRTRPRNLFETKKYIILYLFYIYSVFILNY